MQYQLFTPARLRYIAKLLLLVFTPMALQFSNFWARPRIAHAETGEARRNLWGDLPSVLILESFPSNLIRPADSSGGAEPLAIRPVLSSTNLRYQIPPDGGEAEYEGAQVTFTARSVQPFGSTRTISDQTLPIGGGTITWNGRSIGGERLPDGIYDWQYEAAPIIPPDCVEECPDPTPVTSHTYSVIIDDTSPVIHGLRNFKDGWIGVELSDAMSGVERVSYQIRGGGTAGSGVIPLEQFPRRAVVHLPIPSESGADAMVDLTVYDRAGNIGAVTLPLHPVVRTAQQGVQAPWPSFQEVVGGEPHTINLVTGNGFITHDEISLPAYTMSLDVSRSYNHQNRQKGLLGWGWRLSLEADLRIWTDAAGNWSGKVVTWQDPSGTEFTFDLSSGGEARAHVDGIARAWPRLASVNGGYRLRFPDGTSIRFDSQGRTDAFVDNGGQIRISYSRLPDGRPDWVTATGTGRAIKLDYNPENGLVSSLTIHQDGAPQGKITFRYDAAAPFTGETYDTSELREVDGLAGRKVRFAYDSAHRLTEIRHLGLGAGAITWTYGNAGAGDRANENRLTKIGFTRSDAVSEDRVISYPEERVGHVQILRAPGKVAAFTALRWDELGRPFRMARKADDTTWLEDTFAYQGHNLISHLDPGGLLTTWSYDGNDNPTEELLPDRTSKTRYTYEYDSDDLIRTVKVDQIGSVDGVATVLNTTTDTYESGRLVKSVGPDDPRDPDYPRTDYFYHDDTGLLEAVDNPFGFVTAYDYDWRGQLIRITDWPDRRTRGEVTDADAIWTEFAYDGLGSLAKSRTKLYEGAQPEVQETDYQFDWATGKLTVTHHQSPMAERFKVRDTVTRVDYLNSYLPGNRPKTVVRAYAGAPYHGGEEPEITVASYTYDNAGQLRTERTTEGQTIRQYDQLGNMTLLARRPWATASDEVDRTHDETAPDSVVAYSYDMAGRVTIFQNERGAYSKYTWDRAGRLTGERVAFTNDFYEEELLDEITYGYDKLSRITSVSSPVSGTETLTYTLTDDGLKVINKKVPLDPLTGTPKPSEEEFLYNRIGDLTLHRVDKQYTEYKASRDGPMTEVRQGSLRKRIRREIPEFAASAVLPGDPGGGSDGPVTEEVMIWDRHVTYLMDGRGRVTSQWECPPGAGCDPKRFEYDAFDRLHSSHVPTGSAETLERFIAYDAEGRPFYEYTPNDDERVNHYYYNLAGEPIWELRGDNTYFYRYDYDTAGTNHRLAEVQSGRFLPLLAVPGGGAATEIQRLKYDGPRGELSAVEGVDPLRPSSVETLYSFGFNEMGQLDQYRRGTERYGFLSYDPLGRQTAAYTPDGNSKRITWQRPPQPSAPEPPDEQMVSATFRAPGTATPPTTYDKVYGGYLFKVENADGTFIQKVIDANGNVVAERDEMGMVTTYEYDSQGRLLARTDPNHNTVRYTYDGLNRVETETDARDNTTTYFYENNGLRVIKVDPREGVTVEERNLLGQPLKVTDANGNSTTYNYDKYGLLTSVTTPRGSTWEYFYDKSGGLERIKDPLGNETVITRDGMGRVLSIKDAEHETEYFTYNQWGKVATHTNREGKTTEYGYNSSGRLISIKDPETNEVELTQDDRGLHTATKDALDHETRYIYNDRHQLERVEEPGGKVTVYDYDPVGRRTYVKDAQGNETHFVYDDGGRLVQERFGTGFWIDYEYDPNGNLTVKRDSAGATTSYQYDELNRVTRVDSPDGTWKAYTYDAVGNKLTETTAGGTTTYTYWPDNQVHTVTFPDGTLTEYIYDAAGNVDKKIVNGREEDYDYDRDNRVSFITDSLGYRYEYKYDRDGYVKEIKLPNGLTTHFEYDDRHNIRKQWTEGAGGVITSGEYTNEERGYRDTAVEDGRAYRYVNGQRGQLENVTTPQGDVIHYEYDGAGNLLRRSATIGGGTVNLDRTITVDELMDAILRTIKAREDADGEKGEQEEPEAPEGTNTKAKKFARLEKSLVAAKGGNGGGNGQDNGGGNGQENGGGNGQENGGGNGQDNGGGNGQDNGGGNGQENGGGNGQGNGGGNGQENGGGNGQENGGGNGPGNGNGNGNGQAKERGQGQGQEKGQGKGNEKGQGMGKEKAPKAEPGIKGCQALEHGKGLKLGLYRKCAEELGIKTGLEFHLLSIIDNLVNGEYYLPPGDKEELFALVREVGEGYTILGTTYQYNDKNQLTSRHNLVRDEVHAYGYDARGNMTTNGRTSFTWNDENRLIQAVFPDEEGVRYTYDAIGRRTSKTTFNAQGQGLHTTYYDYEGGSWNVSRERNKDGEVVASYSYDLKGRPLTITYGGATYWYVYNGHGDVVALTDASGTKVAWYEYDEWGRLQAMYDQSGRVREGYGTIGDIGTGPTRPATGMPTPGSTAEPKKGKSKSGGDERLSAETLDGEPLLEEPQDLGEVQIQGVIGEPDDLVKVNPYRYAGYRYDRETQYYYLQQRNYDARLARFLSQDTWPGDVRSPLTLNRYIYAVGDPVNKIDPDGRHPLLIAAAILAGAGLIVGFGYGYWKSDGDIKTALLYAVGGAAIGAALVVGYVAFFYVVTGALTVASNFLMSAAVSLSLPAFIQFANLVIMRPLLFGAIMVVLETTFQYLADAENPTWGGYAEALFVSLLLYGVEIAPSMIGARSGSRVKAPVTVEAEETLAAANTVAVKRYRVTQGRLPRVQSQGPVSNPAVVSNSAVVSNPVVRPVKLAGRNLNHLNGAIAEHHGYVHATQTLNHLGIQAPGKVTATGPDYITYDPVDQMIWVWDAKYSRRGRFPTQAKGFHSAAWLQEVQDAVSAIADPKLRKEVQQAFGSNRLTWEIFRWPQ